MKPKPSVNIVEDINSEAITIGASSSVDEQVNQIDNMLKSIIFTMNSDYDSDCDEFDGDCVPVIRDDHNFR